MISFSLILLCLSLTGTTSGGVTFSVNPPTVYSGTADVPDVSESFNATNDSSPPNGGNKGLEVLDPNDRLIELILDISNELDINVLCHKILLNVGYLTQADKCSLFLARGPRDKRYLEAKLFDVDANTSKSSINSLYCLGKNILKCKAGANPIREIYFNLDHNNIVV